jgi:hypothetical protein
MNANERVEKASAEREARDAVAARGHGPQAAVEAALKRYLAAEQYHEHEVEEQPEEDGKPEPQARP